MSRSNLSAWAVAHPTLILFLILMVAGAGAFSYAKPGRAEDPSFTIKARVHVSGHQLGALPHDVEGTHQIYIDDPLKLLDIERATLAKHLPGVGNACRIDANVDPAKCPGNFGDCRGDGGTIGHIHRHRDGWCASLFGNRSRRVGIAVQDRHPRSSLRQGQGCGSAQT